MKCPACGFDNPPEMRFCGMCGTRLARACPACGFANPPGFRFCGQCGTPLIQAPGQPQPGVAVGQDGILSYIAPVRLEGERRLATVVIADVTGSTDLLERVGTEVWVEIMSRVLQMLESEVYRFGGEVDQFRGDGLVAFFGATSAHEDDPERAVLAALAMHRALEPYAAELADQRAIDLRLHVGVNTGEVIVASIGDRRQHSEDTAMGAGVAIAARMEEAAEPGTVLVSEHTYRLVQSQFEWQPLGEIAVKGVSQPIAVYRPLACRGGVRRPDRLRAFGLFAPLIGRETEFNALRNCIEGLRAERGGIVIVTGDEGMGKSHLVAQVRQHLTRDRALLAEACSSDLGPDGLSPLDLTWLQGRCRSYDQSSPYSTWLDLLRDWLGMREGESKEETRDLLHRQAELLWGDHLAEHYPYLATILSLPLEEAFAGRVRHLDAGGLRQQFFLTVRSWVEALAARGPLVLAFEDLHWADTTSLELLEYCLPLCDHQALLWLLLFRPERASPAWGFRHRVETEYPHRVTVLTLLPLTEAQSCEFIGQLVGADALPAETCALLLSKSEGNPYYIQELIHSLIEQGVLAQEAETSRWRTRRPVVSLDLPDTLQSLLLARIDCLSPEERHVLQMAAVIGSVFWSNVLQALADGAAAPGARLLEAHLTALQRAQVIHARGRVPELGMEYAFKSTLIRDAAYESILSAQRVTYHRQVAECLENLLGPETWAQYCSALAYHYRRAGEPRKELFYTVQAAERAKGVYANVEALGHYTRALELLDEMEAQATDENRLYAIRTQRFEVLDGRRAILLLMGDFEAGRADARALLQLAHQLESDPVWLLDALLRQPGVADWRSREELDAGVSMARQALALAQQLDDRHREMQSLFAIANQRIVLNDPTWQEVGERALELARQLGDRHYEARILITLGLFYSWTDQPEQGATYLEAALPICQALDDKVTEIDLLSQLGLQAERAGDYYRLLTEYQQKRLRLSREIGYREGEGTSLMLCGQTQSLYLGDYEGGLALLEEARGILQGTSNEMYVLLRIAQIQAMQRRYGEAQQVIERMGQIDALQAVLAPGRAGLHLVSAILYNAMGDEDYLVQALELAAQARRIVADTPLFTRPYEIAVACQSAVAHLGLAEWAASDAGRQAHRHQALQASQAALDLCQALGFVQIIECTSEEIFFCHSQALAANGRQEEAAAYLQRAHDEVMRKHALIPPDTPFHRTYLENIPLHRDIHAAYGV
jgi:class 3 adenylate cyclase/tetratricopeptide (TPR) repeat protein